MYKYLLTYRYSEIVCDLNVEFCERFINKFSRTYDQMIQAANLILTLCHQLTYLLDRQIKAQIEKFSKEGGFTENLLKRRLNQRSLK